MKTIYLISSLVYYESFVILFNNFSYSIIPDVLNKKHINIRDNDKVLILCELDKNEEGENMSLQSFYGIEIAKKLRIKGLKSPILFTSFMPRKALTQNHPEHEIINTIGHDFIRLPAKPEDFIERFNNIEPLNDLELRDIQLHYCDAEGGVKVKIHQIEGVTDELQRNPGNAESIKEKLIKCIEEIHNLFGISYNQTVTEFNSLYEEITSLNINDAITYIRYIGNQLITKYSASKNQVLDSSIKEKKKWKVLMLDDELNKDSNIVKKLIEKGADVICTSDAAQALKAIKEDTDLRGEITVILTDYRLNTFDAEQQVLLHQKIQGYKFLQIIGETYRNKLLGAVIYSGLPRQFLIETFKSFKINCDIYSKIDFQSDDERNMNYLAQMVIEAGDNNYESLLALPLGNKGWKDNLHNTYLEYRNLVNFKSREKAICEDCTKWVDHYKAGRTPQTPMIKGDIFSIKKNEKQEDYIKRFEAFYKTRRLAMFLKIHMEHIGYVNYREDIAKILMPEGKKINETTIKRFFSQTLGLSLSEFPLGATIEELNWFDYDLGYKVLDNYSAFRNKLIISENITGEFILNCESLKTVIRDKEFHFEKDNINLVFNEKNWKPCFFDSKDLGACEKIFKENKNILSDGEYKLFLKYQDDIKRIWKLD